MASSLDTTCQQISTLKKEVDELNITLSTVQEKITQQNHIKDMLTTMDAMKVDLSAIQDLKLIHNIVATIPHKNFEGLQQALKGSSFILSRRELTKENDFVFLTVPGKLH